MVANILPTDPPLPYNLRVWVNRSKFNIFRTWSQILCLQTAPVPGVGVKKVKIQLSEHGHIAYQIKGNPECSNMVANILPTDPPPPPPHNPRDGVNRVVIQLFSEYGHVAYQIKWNHELQQHGSKCFAPRPPPPFQGCWRDN